MNGWDLEPFAGATERLSSERLRCVAMIKHAALQAATPTERLMDQIDLRFVPETPG
jgi:hypothetical protein